MHLLVELQMPEKLLLVWAQKEGGGGQTTHTPVLQLKFQFSFIFILVLTISSFDGRTKKVNGERHKPVVIS